MAEVVTVASSATGPNYAFVYILFILAGLLVGGAWSAYQAANRRATYGLAVIAAVAIIAALYMLIGEMS